MGIATTTEGAQFTGHKWNIGSAQGKGVEACYAAVMQDADCGKDYFTYTTRSDENCGCKKAGTFKV